MNTTAAPLAPPPAGSREQLSVQASDGEGGTEPERTRVTPNAVNDRQLSVSQHGHLIHTVFGLRTRNEQG